MYLLLLSLALTLFFLLALTRPRRALILLAALLPCYLLRFSIAGIPTNFFEAAVWLAFLSCLFRSPGLRITSYRLRFLVTLIFLFLFSAILSALLTPTPHSFGILKSWILTPIVFAWMVRGAAPAVAYQRRLEVITALIISGVIVSLLGLFQIGALSRITSIYDVPNSLALFIAPIIILALFRGGCLNYAAALIMFTALLATQSLAGLAAVLIVMFLARILPGLRITDYGLRIPSLPITRYSLLFLFLLSLSFLTLTGRLTYFLQPLYNSSVQTSLTVRQQLWRISWELIKENPIRGIGLGQFEPAYQQKLHEKFRHYGLRITDYEPIHEFVFRDPHNWILSFWLNTGLLGLLSFAALNLLALRPLFSRSVLPVTHYSLLLSLLCLLLFGLLDTIYWKNDLAALQWLLILITTKNRLTG